MLTLTRLYSSPDGKLRQFIYGPGIRHSTPDFPIALELGDREGGHVGDLINVDDPDMYVGLGYDGRVIHANNEIFDTPEGPRPAVSAPAVYLPAHLVNKGDTGR